MRMQIVHETDHSRDGFPCISLWSMVGEGRHGGLRGPHFDFPFVCQVLTFFCPLPLASKSVEYPPESSVRIEVWTIDAGEGGQRGGVCIGFPQRTTVLAAMPRSEEGGGRLEIENKFRGTRGNTTFLTLVASNQNHVIQSNRVTNRSG